MIATSLILASAAFAPIPERWVDAVEHIESSGRGADTPLGDGSRAKGPFQFWSEAWADCSRLRKKAGLPVYPYSKASDPHIARQYATTWLSWLRSQVGKQLGRPANLGETWLAYNLGVTGFARYGYQISKVPDRKFIKAASLNNSVR
jgi:hypothetical protein